MFVLLVADGNEPCSFHVVRALKRKLEEAGMARDKRALLSTAEVAAEVGVELYETRRWAAENGVSKVGSSYAWTRADVERFLSDLEADDEADDDDQDDDDQDDDDQDDDDQDDDDQDDDEDEDD